MNKFTFAFCLLAAIAFISCDPDSKKSTTNTSVSLASNDCPVPQNASGTKGISCSGYDYIHHVSNNTTKPNVGDQLKYHKLVFKNDTTLLQSTYMLLEPRADILIPRDSVPKPPHPTYDVLFLMSPGDSLTVYQSLDTFPAEKLPKNITNKDFFTYHLKLLSIKPKEVIDAEINATKARHVSTTDSLRTFIKDYKAGKLDDKIVTTESGLKYVMHKKGTGKEVKDGGFVKVHYTGVLEDGTLFDGTYQSAKPFPTRIGRKQVIAGWDEGIPLMKEGGEATFFVPYQLAYGIAGRPPGIPQRADLFFHISLVSVY